MTESSKTVKELIFFSYANLAMSHMAVSKNQAQYEKGNFIVRSRLFKGLQTGKMNIKTLFDDEKVKLQTGQKCNYCGATENLALDHIFPQKLGGQDASENLIFACRVCNSSKGKKDLMEWMNYRKKILPLLIIRRYLKLVYYYCLENNLLEYKIEELKNMKLPFKLEYLPVSFPNPQELIL